MAFSGGMHVCTVFAIEINSGRTVEVPVRLALYSFTRHLKSLSMLELDLSKREFGQEFRCLNLSC